MSGRMFVADVGFRAPGTLLPHPVSFKRDGVTLTVERLVVSPDAVDLTYDFGDVDSGQQRSTGTPQQDQVSLYEGTTEHRPHAAHFNLAVRPGKLVRTMTLQGLGHQIRAAELEISSRDAGEWRVPVELVPFGEVGTRSVSGAATHEGVTIALTEMYAGVDVTALELRSADLGQGIGGLHGLREGATALTLRDQTGRTHPETARPDARDQFPGRRMDRTVALFPALPDDARELELEVPFVCVSERGARAEIALPVAEPVSTMLGRYPIRVLATGEAQANAPWHRGPAVAIDLDTGTWVGDRRLLYATQAKLDGVACGMGWGRGISAVDPKPVDHLEVPTADPLAAHTLVLEGATVQVRGPWRLRFSR